VAAVEILLSLGDVEEATQRLENVVWADPIDSSASLLLARLILADEPASPRGLALARRAHRFGGGVEAVLTLARAMRSSGELDRAVGLLEAATTRWKDHGTLLYELALSQTEAGHLPAARQALQSALQAGDFPEQARARAALERLTEEP
jgi:predicted Zn-dependent protease